MAQEGKKEEDNPRIHDDLKGFNIHIDEFGQVKTTLSQEDLNSFLNEQVDDKKFSPKVKKQLEELYTTIDQEE
ncbi:hypothetical protein KUV50_09200 [Membranicola marinus]|uniref:Uncharacterized protein n=1 Tax=Membranihabitans marinus TaxID=1227546 RepID=A0A953L905_9BACT|nr:hypothetical protein [Membranihabitans marinus]MBY5958305.1 hypothetical protein [Membranihabitans marinus]